MCATLTTHIFSRKLRPKKSQLLTARLFNRQQTQKPMFLSNIAGSPMHATGRCLRVGQQEQEVLLLIEPVGGAYGTQRIAYHISLARGY